MKKVFTLVLILVLVSSSAYAFDFAAWLKGILGINEPEQPTEVFVPIEEIKTNQSIETTSGVPATEENPPVASGKGKVIIVQETDKVSLAVSATDPDQDVLTYTYTTPIDKEGEWQTTYGDAGEYTVTITVSDGKLSASDDVLIVVNKKEEAPTIDSFKPESLTLEANENTGAVFSVSASDKNKDTLVYNWKLDGDDVSTTDSFTYKIGYDAAGSHTIKLTISDGNLETTKLWSLDVKNLNRAPILAKMSEIKVKETDTVTLKPEATDPDGDQISYQIGDDGIWQTDYDSAGEYNVEITASDGTDSVKETVKVIVENVNRAPVIGEIAQK